MTLVKFFGVVLFLLIGNSLIFANCTLDSDSDSAVIFKKIKDNELKYKLQQSKLLRKINSENSQEIYVVDNLSSKITSISVIQASSNKERLSKIYWFIDNQLFKITINIANRTSIGIWKTKSSGFYFFSDNLLYYKEETNITNDVQLLLKDANEYLNKGLKLLKEE